MYESIENLKNVLPLFTRNHEDDAFMRQEMDIIEENNYGGICPIKFGEYKDHIAKQLRDYYIVAVYDEYYTAIYIIHRTYFGEFLNWVYDFDRNLPMGDECWGWASREVDRYEWSVLKSYIEGL